MIAARHVVLRNARVYRRAWRGSLFGSFLQPTLFLIAMGIGLGSMVDAAGAELPGGVSYLQFLSPGLLAAACMQTASFESSFPVMGKMTWQRTYEAMTTTRLRVSDIVIGELAWIGVRLTMVATAFLLVLAAFGIARAPLAVLAVPAAVLTGMAFSAPIFAYAVTLSVAANFNALFRFGITPLFLFSGVFFPLSRLPDWLQTVAWFTPLFHGVELVRGLMLGTLTSPAWMLHVGYLATFVAGGTATAMWTLDWKLRR